MSTMDSREGETVISRHLECGDLWLIDGRTRHRQTRWLVTDRPVDLDEWR